MMKTQTKSNQVKPIRNQTPRDVLSDFMDERKAEEAIEALAAAGYFIIRNVNRVNPR